MNRLYFMFYLSLFSTITFGQIVDSWNLIDKKTRTNFEKSHVDFQKCSTDTTSDAQIALFEKVYTEIRKHTQKCFKGKNFPTNTVLRYAAYFTKDGKLECFSYGTQDMISAHWSEEEKSRFKKVLQECFKNYSISYKCDKPFDIAIPFPILQDKYMKDE